MEAATLTLAEFLVARVAERERLADDTHIGVCSMRWSFYPPAGEDLVRHCGCAGPELMRADCLAIRRIIEMHPGAVDGDECPGCGAWLDGAWKTGPDNLCPTLLALVQPYAEHPQFRDEWLP